MTSTVKRFIVLGDTGAGKSAFINSFYNYCYGTHDPESVFRESQNRVKIAIPCKYWEDRRTAVVGECKSTERDIEDQTKSQTMCCTTHTLQFTEGGTEPHAFIFELIDTPGFNDTEGVDKDDSNVCQIEKAVNDVAYLNGIIIVVNGSTSRLGTSFQYFMRLIQDIWPNDLMKNVCVVLTNCDDTTSNIKPEFIHELLKVNQQALFYMQNSLFRWDRKSEAKKVIRNLSRDFIETIETLKTLAAVLSRFQEVSTAVFKKSAIQQHFIQRCIHDAISNIIQMLQIHRQRNVVEKGLDGATATMAANKNWEKKASIKVIKWMEVEEPHSVYSATLPNHYRATSYPCAAQSCSRTPDFKDDQRLTSSRPSSLTNCFVQCLGGESTSSDTSKKTQIHTSSAHNNTGNNFTDFSYGKLLQPEISEEQSVRHRAKQNNERADRYSHRTDVYDPRLNHYNYGVNYFNDRRNYYDPSYYYGQRFRPNKTFRAEERRIQVTLDDNEAKEIHEAARRERKDLREKRNEFDGDYATIENSLVSHLNTLNESVQEMRAINMAVDLLEKNKVLLYNLRNEINLGGNDPSMVEVYEDVVHILTKTIELRSTSS